MPDMDPNYIYSKHPVTYTYFSMVKKKHTVLLLHLYHMKKPYELMKGVSLNCEMAALRTQLGHY